MLRKIAAKLLKISDVCKKKVANAMIFGKNDEKSDNDSIGNACKS